MKDAGMKLLVIYEDAGTNYSAYLPDLPGCVSTGATKEEVACNIREAVALHLAGMRQDGDPWPEPAETWAEVIDVTEADIDRAALAFVPSSQRRGQARPQEARFTSSDRAGSG